MPTKLVVIFGIVVFAFVALTAIDSNEEQGCKDRVARLNTALIDNGQADLNTGGFISNRDCTGRACCHRVRRFRPREQD